MIESGLHKRTDARIQCYMDLVANKPSDGEDRGSVNTIMIGLDFFIKLLHGLAFLYLIFIFVIILEWITFKSFAYKIH